MQWHFRVGQIVYNRNRRISSNKKVFFYSYQHLYWENKREYNGQLLDDKQREHFLHVLIPWWQVRDVQQDLDMTKTKRKFLCKWSHSLVLHHPDNGSSIFLDHAQRIHRENVVQFPNTISLRRYPIEIDVEKWNLVENSYGIDLIQSLPLFFGCADFRSCLNCSLHLTCPND